MSLLLPTLRGFRVLLHIAVGLLIVLVVNLTGREKYWPVEKIMSWWNRVLLDLFNIQVRVHNQGLQGPRLLVANHVSWLDISVIGSLEPTRFVAKSEIRDWPIAGALANACGTFYIRRKKGGRDTVPERSEVGAGATASPTSTTHSRTTQNSKEVGGARPLLEKAVPHLQGGGSFVVFPEGTTTDGTSVLPFHARLFQAAIEAKCAVQPIALRFGRGADGSRVAPFIGNDDLASHMLRLLKEPSLVVDVTYCTPIQPAGFERDGLALAARTAIAAVVAKPLPETLPELEALPV